VQAVSEDETIPGYRRRKAARRQQVAAAEPEALTVFAADKVSEARELRATISTADRQPKPVNASLFPPPRLAHFRHCLGMLEERLGDSPLVEQLRAELFGLTRDLKTHTEIKAVA
jgi:hypothetical protein